MTTLSAEARYEEWVRRTACSHSTREGLVCRGCVVAEFAAQAEALEKLRNRHGQQEEYILPDKHPLRIRAEKAEAELAALRAERDRLQGVAREFIDYYTGPPTVRPNGGCGNCGGLPHALTCFVGRFEAALHEETHD